MICDLLPALRLWRASVTRFNSKYFGEGKKEKEKKKKELISRDPDHPDMNSAFILLNSSLWRAFCL